METLNLAGARGDRYPLLSFVSHYPVPVLVIVVALVAYGVWGYKWSKRQPLEPADEDATLAGTARVLSFQRTNALDSSNASFTYISALENYGSLASRKEKKKARYYCKIKLAVDIPGREPYEAVVKRPFNRADQAAVQPGMIVRVRVDPDDDPQNVLIDLKRAAPPPQAESSG